MVACTRRPRCSPISILKSKSKNTGKKDFDPPSCPVLVSFLLCFPYFFVTSVRTLVAAACSMGVNTSSPSDFALPCSAFCTRGVV